MNVLDESAMDEIEAAIERLKADPAVKAALFVSRKESFSAGADLSMLAGLTAITDPARQLATASRLAHLFRRLETCGKPIAAAIHGVCLGGAFELALACHYRVAADDAATKLGLPESKIGLLPGGGGTQRLPRLIGAEESLKLMLRGTHVPAREALRLGMVHELGAPDGIEAMARAWLLANPGAVQPWDTKSFRIPGGAPASPHGSQMWAAANAIYRKETFDNYDAQRGILTAVHEGLGCKSIDAGLRIEAAEFTKLLRGPQSRVMIRSLFHSMQALNKGARRPAAPPSRVARLGIAGAGFMGAGIAGVAALAGIEVVLLDQDAASAAAGKDKVARTYEKRRAAGAEAALARIVPVQDYSAFADCDLVIEAVFENRAVKAEAWPKIDAALPTHAVRASNTSTLPITGLSAHVRDAASFIGIHFFSPVERMQLVEVIRGKATSDETVARALDFVRQIGKTPIVVNDARGFFTSRVVTAHIAEAHWMLDEGVPPALIENAGRMAGMPVGPLALADEIALDLQWRILQAAKTDLGQAYAATPMDRIIQDMVEGRERFGRKNGKGYYDYGPAGKFLWPGLADIAPPKPASHFDAAEIKERLLLIQALETARCFDEDVLTDAREADVGAILGFGFAPFTGGPLSYIDTMGPDVFAAKCRQYEKRLGARYAPPVSRRYYDAA